MIELEFILTHQDKRVALEVSNEEYDRFLAEYQQWLESDAPRAHFRFKTQEEDFGIRLDAIVAFSGKPRKEEASVTRPMRISQRFA